MKSISRKLAALTAVCVMSAAAFAADASGTWKWTMAGRGGGGGGGGGGQPREVTLSLTQKDGALTGNISMPGRDGSMEFPISKGTIKDDTVTFEVEREFNGNKFVTKYTGKISGDTITGESEGPGRDGQTMKREWTAKRAK